jgi:tetratricopeptide (TPR) repeat protein
MSLLHLRKTIVFLAVCAAVPSARACGPFFPNQVIAGGSSDILKLPNGRFSTELDQLNRGDKPPFKAVNADRWGPQYVFEQSEAIDEKELETVLKESGKKTGEILQQYRAVREQIAKHARSLSTDKEKPFPMDAATVPDGLPDEFTRYLQGLIAFHQDKAAEAQQAWQALLNLPADQRKHRSTWAAFMLGKSLMVSQPDRAVEYFDMTRKLAADGFTDTLGLAASSLGWQAKTELDRKHFESAVAFYSQQRLTGDITADSSLRICAIRIMDAGPDALAAAAKDADAQRVVTAYLLCDGGPFWKLSHAEKELIPLWLSVVENAGVKDMPGADRLAWLAYSSGDFDVASRWVARSAKDSAVANWVRAKLLLRDGKTDEAARVLVKVVRSFPAAELDQAPAWDYDDDLQTIPQLVTTDLSVLQLARGQYADSMRLLMLSDHWQDAAYIGERVLTSDELSRFVDQYCPALNDYHPAKERNIWKEASQQMRLLLARRLTRQGNWKLARSYFTDDLRKQLDAYIEGIRAGHDKTLSPADRAAGFMTAARIARKDGMELLGTELNPDFHIFDGQFEFQSDKDPRPGEKGLTAPSPDEIARFKASEPDDSRRFHYRYIAAAHAWSAAELMPDNDEQTARILNEAGSWLKDRDPKFADKFYKAIVQRCPDTEIGKAAIATHWFPKPQTATVNE